MADGERLPDTSVLVHAYVRLDEKKQETASEIVLPIWDGGFRWTYFNLSKLNLYKSYHSCHQESREAACRNRFSG